MKLLWTTALLTGIALAVGGPLAAMEKTLSGVAVNADLSAYEDNNVLEYWPTLADDITKAIASQVTVDDTAKAPQISVEINKVAINGNTVLPESGEFNQLEGTVTTYTGPNEDTAANSEASTPDDVIGSYVLRMSAVTGETDAPEGWIIVPPSQDDFYNALVNAYATAIVERIEEE
ncbi:hypothetical protein SAMN05443999_102441 [Roseovarius azorensis]|uniref:Polyketide cyclase / dehydrase and lipid transport n=1 Tax=Roseovarius azorensis TaxID=1287727 RepID=A0A1H7KK63_9RHOB|nr:hypothetical protein [Roseovarius azorensis]SEK87178.1 hypothetical protein SAMN05443999_102441 [Roseovarius azorensis]